MGKTFSADLQNKNRERFALPALYSLVHFVDCRMVSKPNARMRKQQAAPVETSSIRLFSAAMPLKETIIDRCKAKRSGGFRISNPAKQLRQPISMTCPWLSSILQTDMSTIIWFFCSGSNAIVKLWLAEDFRKTPEEIEEVIQSEYGSQA